MFIVIVVDGVSVIMTKRRFQIEVETWLKLAFFVKERLEQMVKYTKHTENVYFPVVHHAQNTII